MLCKSLLLLQGLRQGTDSVERQMISANKEQVEDECHYQKMAAVEEKQHLRVDMFSGM